MNTSGKGISLIKGFEQFRAMPYMPTPYDQWTQGYGSTHKPDGSPVKPTDPGISEPTACEWLAHDVQPIEADINDKVSVPLTQGQFDALVSFVYNVGVTAFDNSTLLKRLNAGNYAAAADEFDHWVFQKGKRLYGLVRRRAAENGLFLS